MQNNEFSMAATARKVKKASRVVAQLTTMPIEITIPMLNVLLIDLLRLKKYPNGRR